jgi:hypothetical protein
MSRRVESAADELARLENRPVGGALREVAVDEAAAGELSGREILAVPVLTG